MTRRSFTKQGPLSTPSCARQVKDVLDDKVEKVIISKTLTVSQTRLEFLSLVNSVGHRLWLVFTFSLIHLSD
jgi:hypothetical protein